MLDYEKDCKAVFAEKLAQDLTGRGRIESAAFHTAEHIYLKGVEDGGLAAAKLAEVMHMAGIYTAKDGATLADLLGILRRLTATLGETLETVRVE